ncbi:putative WD repeat protein 96, partial [Toxoplasma gondii RUB]
MMEMDVKLLIEIKQGRVEVSSPAPVNMYEDACIVHKEAIERCNEAILAIGKQKLDILEMIKEFRRKIVMVEWEKQVLDAEARELEEKTKDVHMLRVTKEIQKYLAAD